MARGSFLLFPIPNYYDVCSENYHLRIWIDRSPAGSMYYSNYVPSNQF